MSGLIHFMILYKALTGWIDILLPSNVLMLFGSLHKSFFGWISHIRQVAISTRPAEEMTMEYQQFQQETIRLRAQLSDFERSNEHLRHEKEMWLIERTQLMSSRDDLNEMLEIERGMAQKATTNTTDEMNKLVEKIEKEKSRMKTSYAYFNGLSKAHKEKEDEWTAEKARMAIELIAERTNHAVVLKNEQDRYQSIIQKKDAEHKVHVQRLLQEFKKKLKKC